MPGGEFSTINATITGLKNDTQYTILIRSHNSVGYSQPIISPEPITPKAVPSKPTELVVKNEHKQATISFTPGNSNGSPITDYKYSKDDGITWITTGSSKSPVIIPNLINGTVYSIRLLAVSALGEGEVSASVIVKPKPVPDKPTNLTAEASNNAVIVTFTPGATNGYMINNYQYSTDDGINWTEYDKEITYNNLTITGLINGTSYDVRLLARSNMGLGAMSDSIRVTPATIPNAPIIESRSVSHSKTDIIVKAFDNTNNGGAAITGYSYSYTESLDSNPVFLPGNENNIIYDSITAPNKVTITGLEDGTQYKIKLAAINKMGTGADSSIITVTPATPPDPPTLLVADASNQQIKISFAPGSENYSAISSYQYLIVGPTPDGNWRTDHISITDLFKAVIITDLSNNKPYQIKLRAVNEAGIGAASTTSDTATPYRVPFPLPMTLYNPYDIKDYTYRPNDSRIDILFGLSTSLFDADTPIRDYQYSIQFPNSTTEIINGGWTNCNNLNGISITTLKNGVKLINGTYYDVYIRAVSKDPRTVTDLSGYGDIMYFTLSPAIVPSAPVNLLPTPGNNLTEIKFDLGADNYSKIIGYKYSINNNAWLTTNIAYDLINAPTKITITGLTNGELYNIKLRAVNSVGDGDESTPINVTPVFTPAKPTNLLSNHGDRKITIQFTPGNNNGRQITSYQYKLSTDIDYRTDNITDPVTVNTTTKSVTITNLSNGQLYAIRLRGVNSIGPGDQSDTVQATPSTLPSAPTGLISTRGNRQADIAFILDSSGGSAITNYEYNIDNTTWIPFDPIDNASPVTIVGLTNGRLYAIKLKAGNLNGYGAESSAVTVIPATVPSAPTALFATYGNRQAVISFVLDSSGGDAITNYQYSIDNSTIWNDFFPSITTSPATVRNLINGKLYSIRLRAVNTVGYSNDSSAVSVTPKTFPTPPTSLTALSGNRQTTISFIQDSSGGSAITNYQYSLDLGSWNYFSPPVTSSPVTITDLSNGQLYSIRLRAENDVDYSVPSTPVQNIPATIPSAPTNLVALIENRQTTISFYQDSSGGALITNYSYLLNGGVNWKYFDPSDNASPVTITGLTNGTQYNILLRARNRMGDGPASASVYVTPATIPSAPKLLTALRGDQRATITFTIDSSGGSVITGYKYYIDTWRTDNIVINSSNSITITGLTNGRLYNIKLLAVNSIGDGPGSLPISVTPATIPSAPMNIRVENGNSLSTISIDTGANGGDGIINYQYSLNAGSIWTAFNPPDIVSPFIIKNLLNNTSYNVLLRAVNTVGPGNSSAVIRLNPIPVPTAPTILRSQTPDDNTAEIYFSPSQPGDAPIKYYKYSFNDGLTWTILNLSENINPIIFKGLANGIPHTIILRAVNALGDGNISNPFTFVVINPPIPYCNPTSGKSGAAASCKKVEYVKMATSGNNPNLSNKMRYSQYVKTSGSSRIMQTNPVVFPTNPETPYKQIIPFVYGKGYRAPLPIKNGDGFIPFGANSKPASI